MIEYLASWGRLSTGETKNFDESGTLSHMLILHLSHFEEELRANKKRLPIWEPRKMPKLTETDAERQIAFSQEQRRRKTKEKEDRTSAEILEEKDDHPRSKVRSGYGREGSRSIDGIPKISVSRPIKRGRSNEDRRERGPRVSAEPKRRRYTEPRSRSKTDREGQRMKEERRSRSRRRRRTEPRSNSGRDRGASRRERHT